MIDFIGFNHRYQQLNNLLPAAESVMEADVDGLHLRLYQPALPVNDVLVVYHGGGVHAGAGYDILARQLTDTGSVAVCLVDIRGHGRSCGERGHVSETERVWRDVDDIVQHLRGRFPRAGMHLLGHSSGGGMLINYFTRYAARQHSDSLILLAPELGPFAPDGLRKTSAVPFAAVKTWPFILHHLSGGRLLGHYPAVRLNFPAGARAVKPPFVTQYSVNMANALTPRDPARQLAALNVPTTLLAASDDELFDAAATCALINGCGNPKLSAQIVESATHLGCIFDVSDALRQHIAGLVR